MAAGTRGRAGPVPFPARCRFSRSPVSPQYLASISPVSRQYLASISPVSRQYLASILPYLHLLVLRFTQLFCLRERLFYSLTRLSNDKDQHVYTFSRLLRPRISLACVRYLPSLSRGHVGSSDIVLEKAPARPARACLPPIRAASCCPVLASAYQLGELNSVVSNSQSAVLNVWSWNLLVFTVWVPHVQDCTSRNAQQY